MKLMTHQIEDAEFLASKSIAGCFSGMGSGKTLTALEAINMLGNSSEHQITLIIGPPISLHMWFEEYESHVGWHAQILRTGKDVIDPEVSALIMSYDIATRRVSELKAIGAKFLVCDESHALKSAEAKRTAAIIGPGGLVETVEHAWFLTGTPETKWHDDLYPFLLAADKKGLEDRTGGNTLERFHLRYCVTQARKFNPYQRIPTILTVGNRNTEELNEWLFAGGLAVRRELADVWKDMPAITINRLQVQLEMTPELSRELKGLRHYTPRQLIDSIEDGQMASLRRMIGAAKVKYSAREIADRIEAGVKPILVGCWHREVIDALAFALSEKHSVGVIDGRTPSKAKLAYTNAFNVGELDVLIGQISAMGVSLNLQGGAHIVVIEEDFSPAVMDQFYARCHRMGQKNHVHVDIFEDGTELGKAVSRIARAKAREHKKVMSQGAS